jgi:hypothetical protein
MISDLVGPRCIRGPQKARSVVTVEALYALDNVVSARRVVAVSCIMDWV